MRKTIFALCLLLLLPLACASQAQVAVQTNKAIFHPGETIIAVAELKNNSGEAVSLELRSLINTTASERFQPRTDIRAVSLQPGEQRRIVVFSLTVKNDFPQANYTFGSAAYVNGIKSSESEKGFKIAGTLSEPVFRVSLCSDSACTQRKKVFVQGEQPYLKVLSDAISPSQKTIIGSIQGLGASASTISSSLGKGMNVEQLIVAGSLAAGKVYSMLLTSADTAFIREQAVVQFAVIDQHPQIKNASQCNANLACEPAKGETSKTCPQDCK